MQTKLSIIIPKEEKEALIALAKALDIDTSKLVRQLIRGELAKHKGLN